jgi:ATP phosphoribosyltransferase
MLDTVAIAAEQLRAAVLHADTRIAELEAEVAEWMKCARDNQEMLNTIGRQLGGKIPEQLVSEIARERMKCIDELIEALKECAKLESAEEVRAVARAALASAGATP